MTFQFDPDAWLTNRALRGCSPAARGFWMDLLALMWAEGGYLTIKGRAIDDVKLARLVGESVDSVNACIVELGEAGVFSVTEDGRMYAPELVRQASGPKRVEPIAPAVHAADINPAPQPPQDSPSSPTTAAAPPRPAPTAAAPKKKPLPWFKTNNGWFKMGQQQALPMREGEDIDDYKCRVAARIEPGAHLDVLTPRQQKMVEALRPKDPNAKANL